MRGKKVYPLSNGGTVPDTNMNSLRICSLFILQEMDGERSSDGSSWTINGNISEVLSVIVDPSFLIIQLPCGCSLSAVGYRISP